MYSNRFRYLQEVGYNELDHITANFSSNWTRRKYDTIAGTSVPSSLPSTTTANQSPFSTLPAGSRAPSVEDTSLRIARRPKLPSSNDLKPSINNGSLKFTRRAKVTESILYETSDGDLPDDLKVRDLFIGFS